MSQRHPVWVAENHVNPCNSEEITGAKREKPQKGVHRLATATFLPSFSHDGIFLAQLGGGGGEGMQAASPPHIYPLALVTLHPPFPPQQN